MKDSPKVTYRRVGKGFLMGTGQAQGSPSHAGSQAGGWHGGALVHCACQASETPPHVLLQMGPVSLFHPLKATLGRLSRLCSEEPVFSFDGELGLPQQRWGSVSAAGRLGWGREEAGLLGIPALPCCSGIQPGCAGLLATRSRTGSPRVLSPPTTPTATRWLYCGSSWSGGHRAGSIGWSGSSLL